MDLPRERERERERERRGGFENGNRVKLYFAKL